MGFPSLAHPRLHLMFTSVTALVCLRVDRIHWAMKTNNLRLISPPPHRRIVLVDAENMSACGDPCAAEVAWTRETLRALIHDWAAAFVVVGSSHYAARTVAFGFPRVRHLWRSGENGADLALLAVMETERIEARFTAITLCSGDGIFAEPLARCVEAGLHTTVIARRGQLSLALRRTAHQVIEISPRAMPAEMRAA